MQFKYNPRKSIHWNTEINDNVDGLTVELLVTYKKNYMANIKGGGTGKNNPFVAGVSDDRRSKRYRRRKMQRMLEKNLSRTLRGIR